MIYGGNSVHANFLHQTSVASRDDSRQTQSGKITVVDNGPTCWLLTVHSHVHRVLVRCVRMGPSVLTTHN